MSFRGASKYGNEVIGAVVRVVDLSEIYCKTKSTIAQVFPLQIRLTEKSKLFNFAFISLFMQNITQTRTKR